LRSLDEVLLLFVPLQTQRVVSEKRFENGTYNEGVLTWIYPSLRSKQNATLPNSLSWNISEMVESFV